MSNADHTNGVTPDQGETVITAAERALIKALIPTDEATSALAGLLSCCAEGWDEMQVLVEELVKWRGEIDDDKVDLERSKGPERREDRAFLRDEIEGLEALERDSIYAIESQIKRHEAWYSAVEFHLDAAYDSDEDDR